jgi:hypothetical protein
MRPFKYTRASDPGVAAPAALLAGCRPVIVVTGAYSELSKINADGERVEEGLLSMSKG